MYVHIAYVITIPPDEVPRFLNAATYCQMDFGELFETAIKDKLQEIEMAMQGEERMNDWFADRSRIEKLIVAALKSSNDSHPGALDPQHVSSISKRVYSVLRAERRKFMREENEKPHYNNTAG